MNRRPPGIALTGLGGGFFSGLTGVGGGAIMVPLMTGVLRMRQHAAHGASLVVIIFVAAASAVVYQLQEGIDWPLVAALLPTSLMGAYLGARLVQRLPAHRLRQVFGAFIFLVGLRLLLFADVAPLFSAGGTREAALGAAIGLVGGLVSGALGVGGGAIFVPALVILLGVDQHAAQGVSLCVIVGAALVGAATHARHGSTDLATAMRIAPLAVPAGLAGAYAASLIGGATLQRIFAVVVIVVGLQMMNSARRALRSASGEESSAETLTA